MKDINERIIELCIEKKRRGEISFYSPISDIIQNEYGVFISPESIRNISRRYRRNNNLDEFYEKLEEKEIDNCMDENNFDIVNIRTSKWQMMDKDGNIKDMVSSKFTMKPKKDLNWNQEFVDNVFKNIKIEERPFVFYTRNTKSKQCLVFPISDLHLGMLSEKNVTGNNYNIQIAEKLYYNTINDVLSETADKDFEKIFFVIGNDFLNADNIFNTTTKGTQQDNSNMWHTVVDKAIEMCINGINRLLEKSKVDVIYVPSNHDYHTMYGVVNVLKAYYRNTKDVNILGDPSERKYVKYGNTMMCFSHDMKIDRALEIMTTEAKDIWCKSFRCILFLGHLHTQMSYMPKGSLEIYRLPTISGWSRWSNQQGYIQNEKKNQSFIIDKEKGIKRVINTVL